jgi:hypothetical protein
MRTWSIGQSFQERKRLPSGRSRHPMRLSRIRFAMPVIRHLRLLRCAQPADAAAAALTREATALVQSLAQVAAAARAMVSACLV